MKRIILSLTILLAALRLLITPRLDLPTATGSYEATAHLWVGLLLGLWLGLLAPRRRDSAWLCFWSATALSLWELLLFTIQKLSP